jgi:integrase/recombinase XerD
LAGNTILAYGRDLKDFLQYCNSIDIKELQQINQAVVQRYIHILGAGDKSESSTKRALVAVRMFIKFAKLTGLIQNDFTAILEGPKLWQRLPIVCSKQQVVDLLNAPSPKEPFYLRDKVMLELLYATGVRASELAGLKIADLNFEVGYLRCKGKGGRERIIPVGKTAIAAAVEYLKGLRPKLNRPFSNDFLLLSRTGRPMGRIEIWRLIKKYALRAGMPRNLTVHTLRHCFATHLLAGGADIRSVQEMLGHVDIATTQIYTHVDMERLRSIHRKFHPRP